MRSLLSLAFSLAIAAAIASDCQCARSGELRAGAFAQVISPAQFPAPVNGGMKGAFAHSVHDHLHARCLALKEGDDELILCVVDACMIPRDICERAKRLASEKTGVPTKNMLVSATHTHSAATLAAVFQSEPDPAYVAALPERIAQGMERAHANLEPAEIAYGRAEDATQVFNRRWLVKAGEQNVNPFGAATDRAWMNPGYANAKVEKPAGPVDPEIVFLAVRSAVDNRPLALLANYGLHYVGGQPAISADYFAAFADEMTERLQAKDSRYDGRPAFVGIMSNGASGDVNNVNFGGEPPPRRSPGEQIKTVARSVAEAVRRACEGLSYRREIDLAAAELDLPLKIRKPSPEDIVRANDILSKTKPDQDGQFSDRAAIYARETILLAEYPAELPVKLQALRVGELTIGAIPCEVFAEIGLEIKRRRPPGKSCIVSLANGYNGYLPTADQHALGGYETWRARSSYLETGAAAKIVERLSILMDSVKQ